MRYDAIIFDMDGVIVDSEPVYLGWLEEFLIKEGYKVTRNSLETMVGLSSVQNRRMLEKFCSDGKGSKLWDAYVKTSEEYEVDYKKILNRGVKELLEYLKIRGIGTGLASSSNMKDIQTVLKDTGLKQYFDVVMSGEMFRESKPNPEIYICTAELLGTTAEKCVIIEDSDYGIAAGKRAGGYVIAKREIRFGFKQQEADLVADDMQDIRKIIEALDFL